MDIKLGPFRGIDNRAEDYVLPQGSKEDPRASVRNAVNVDFTNSGRFRRRRGLTKVYSGFTKGGYGCPSGEFFVENGVLKRFNANNTATTIYAGITGSTFTYEYFNGVVYFSDGVICLKILPSSVVNWGIAPPNPPAMYTTSGSYGGGDYLACCAFVDADGVESGPSEIASFSAIDNCGIVFGGLPSFIDPQVVAVRLYLSMPNGNELFHVADVTGSSYTITAGRYDNSNVLDTHFVSTPPAGRIIRFYKGRMYVADATGFVWYSEPYQLDHFKLGSNFLQFTDPVDVMEPVDDGIYFAYGDRTDFYAGTPEDGFTVLNIFDYGAIFGSGGKDGPNVVWQSTDGSVVGRPSGNCQNVQETHVSVDNGESAATVVREYDGVRQFIASIKQPSIGALAAKSWIDAEVIRRGA